MGRINGALARGALLVAVLAARRAGADPQASLGLTLGAAVDDVAGSSKPEGTFHLGGRFSVLFLRDRGNEMAIGPYLDAATAGFRNLDLGGGAEWLLPVRDDLPLVLSAGWFWRDGRDRSFSPGMEGTVFFGSRSYNFHSAYGLAAGVFAQSRYIPSPTPALDLIFGVQIDGELLALPVVFLYEALR